MSCQIVNYGMEINFKKKGKKKKVQIDTVARRYIRT